jgi:hypothetical protein
MPGPESPKTTWETTVPKAVVKRPDMSPDIRPIPVPRTSGDRVLLDVSLGLDGELPLDALRDLRRFSRSAAHGQRAVEMYLNPGKEGSKDIAESQRPPRIRGYESPRGNYRMALNYERDYVVDDEKVRRDTGIYYDGIVSDETDFILKVGRGVISREGVSIEAKTIELALRSALEGLNLTPGTIEAMIGINRRRVYDLAEMRRQEGLGLYKVTDEAIREVRTWKAHIEPLAEGEQIHVGPRRPDRERKQAEKQSTQTPPAVVRPAAASS